ncbi:MAG: 5-methylcytosine-specific restriction endonuclease system specificity protein McrC [Dehalococcoidia bacterium]|nr:5-methylcytosine-specific restriction endonuclease system specificity protein McrC [Dehalococcoidia bacterium]
MSLPAIVTATDPISYLDDKVPVRNIWLLMLYASDLYRYTKEERIASIEENPDDIADLVAEILAGSVERRIRRNMSFAYQSKDAVLSRLRGRVDLLRTERGQLLRRGKIACRYDELTIDTPRNRFVRAALTRIAKTVQRDDLARRCRTLATTMGRMGVGGHLPHLNDLSIASFGRLDADDRQMVAAAQLALDPALPNESDGASYLSKPYTEREWWRLFEKAVAGFYGFVLKGQGWRVRPQHNINWPIVKKTEDIDNIFPSMQPDIVLDDPSVAHRIVIDTKFTSILQYNQGWYRPESLKRNHIFQIYAYLRSQEDSGDPLWSGASGLLLYPEVKGRRVDEFVTIQGHEIRFATVDLTTQATEIRNQLLQAIQRSPQCQPT